MTFYDISMKMLAANFKRYKLYFLCNVFSITLFYSFAAIFTNKSFMDKNIVDPFISSNIYAPSVFVAIFLALFIPYSYNAFSKNRKHEYGILMTLGMSEKEVLGNMLLENCIIAGISLISGLVLGTAVSFVFYFIINHVIGISGFKWYFNMDSYKVTIILYGVVILFTLLTGILGFVKMQITDLIKEKFRGENIKHYSIKINSKYVRKHIIELSFIKQHNKSRNIIAIAAALLIGFCIFFAGLCAIMYPSHVDNVMAYSPYDMVYSQIFGMNQVQNNEIENLLNKNGVSVKNVKQVNYLRSNSSNILPISEVNKEFNCHYKISEGKFMTVFQYYLKDGYKHEMNSFKTVNFNCGDKKIVLQSAGNNVRILFNRNPAFADQTLVLNDEDYSKIASGCHDVWAGIMKLYSFDNWKSSKNGVDTVNMYLLNKNRVGKLEQQQYYNASSKIETYITAKQSSEFLIFMMIFVEILFCTASDIMIHFKIKAESEEEQRGLSGLYKIGVTEEEMLGMIKHKNIYYFMPQVIIGLFIGVFYSYAANKFYGYGLKAAGYSLLFGILLAMIQLFVVKNYSGRELTSFNI